MQKLDPEHDDIEQFYNMARDLRQAMRCEDQAVQYAAAARMRIIPGWRELDDDEIISTPIPLNLGKLVIALEHGYESWGEMRTFIGEREIARMEAENLEQQ